jgi:hypothetical protein
MIPNRHPVDRSLIMSAPPSPQPQQAPSRWLGPAVGITLLAVLLHATYTLWTGPRQTDGWTWTYRLTKLAGVAVGIWLGIQLIRQRPRAFFDGMVIFGSTSILLLAATLFMLIAHPGSPRTTLTIALVAILSAVLSWLLWRQWRRTGRSAPTGSS